MKISDNERIGLVIRDARIAKRMSLRELSQSLKITPVVYGQYERGVKELPLYLAHTLSAILEIPFERIKPTPRVVNPQFLDHLKSLGWVESPVATQGHPPNNRLMQYEPPNTRCPTLSINGFRYHADLNQFALYLGEYPNDDVVAGYLPKSTDTLDLVIDELFVDLKKCMLDAFLPEVKP